MSHKTAATVAHTIGIDTGKNTLHLIGLDEKGAIVLREKLARGRIAARLANVPRCLIGIEAGMATHYVARELIALGHDVRQVPPACQSAFDRAIEDYNGAISLGSKNPQHFVNRAAALTIKGDYDLAEADFEAALRFDNKNAVALYGRGFVKNKRGDDTAGRQDMLDGTKLNANAERAFVIATKAN
jgi:tetratricopeptide (TPR) repeat protein